MTQYTGGNEITVHELGPLQSDWWVYF